MQKWEYRVFLEEHSWFQEIVKKEGSSRVNAIYYALNLWGDEGWELVTFQNDGVWVFKRPKQ